MSCSTRNVPSPIALGIVLVLIGCGLQNRAICQDNPFGGADFGVMSDDVDRADSSIGFGNVSSAATASAIPGSTNLTVLELRRDPPQTPEEFARAFLYLHRVKQWQELGRYVDQFSSTPLDPNTAVKMLDEIGAANWFRIIRGMSDLSKPQQDALRSIVTLANEVQIASSQLSRYYGLLSSDERASQKRGLLELETSGAAGLQFVINQILSNETAVPVAASVLISNSEVSAAPAIEAAFAAGTPAQRGRIIELVEPLRKPTFAKLLATYFFANQSSNPDDKSNPDGKTISLASTALVRMLGRVPSAESLQRSLDSDILQAIRDYRRARTLPVPMSRVVWDMTIDGKVQFREATEVEVALNRGYRAAVARQEIAATVDSESAISMAVLLEHDYQSSRTAMVPRPLGRIANLPETVRQSYEFACLVWDASVEHELYGSQLRAVQHLSQLAIVGPLEDEAVISRLRAALNNGYPAIRMAAGQILLSRTDELPPPLANQVLDVAEEMAQLPVKPKALVVGNDDFLRNNLRTFLSQAGMEVAETQTARESIRYVSQPRAIDVVFLVDFTGDMRLSQLIQRLRNHFSTSKIPIVVLSDSLGDDEHQLLESERQIIFGSNPPDLSGLLSILQRVEEQTVGPNLSASDRIVLREIAQDSILQLETNGSTRWDSKLLVMAEKLNLRVTDEQLAKSPISLLSRLRSAGAQRELVRRISSPSRELTDRDAAVRALSASFSSTGVLLTLSDAQPLFQTFNANADADLVFQRRLGQLLKMAEAYYESSNAVDLDARQ